MLKGLFFPTDYFFFLFLFLKYENPSSLGWIVFRFIYVYCEEM